MRGRDTASGRPQHLPSIFCNGLLLLIVATPVPLAASTIDRAREQATTMVAQIQRADYEGDRAALERLHRELAPLVEIKDVGPRVQYWRGFALWRRAINGFNDKVDAKELQSDLGMALDDFEDASRRDPAFADAKIGALSCLGFLAYSFSGDRESSSFQESIARAKQLRKEAADMAPDNPRLAWVMGPMIWNSPPERGGGQAQAIERYQKGLETIRSLKKKDSDPLDPTWGEPELLMSLAWSHLNQTTPDVKAAEQEAGAALKLVPYWHYVRDILMPQIQAAKK
jgi:hypothetical protein